MLGRTHLLFLLFFPTPPGNPVIPGELVWACSVSRATRAPQDLPPHCWLPHLPPWWDAPAGSTSFPSSLCSIGRMPAGPAHAQAQLLNAPEGFLGWGVGGSDLARRGCQRIEMQHNAVPQAILLGAQAISGLPWLILSWKRATHLNLPCLVRALQTLGEDKHNDWGGRASKVREVICHLDTHIKPLRSQWGARPIFFSHSHFMTSVIWAKGNLRAGTPVYMPTFTLKECSCFIAPKSFLAWLMFPSPSPK